MDLHVHSKAIENGVHGAVVADQFHFLAFAVVHSEGCLDVVIDIEVGWNRCGRLIQNRRLLIDPVHPEVSNVLVLFGIAYHVITVSVPDQVVRTEYVFLTAVLQRFSLLRIVVVLLKRNLFAGIDRLVNRIGNIEHFLIVRLEATACFEISLQRVRAVNAGQLLELFNQALALFLCNEF